MNNTETVTPQSVVLTARRLRPLIVSSDVGVWCDATESRIGRQPNAIKHTTFLKLCQIKCAKGIASTKDPFATSEAKVDLAEAGSNEAGDLPDFTVTMSHDAGPPKDASIKPRRLYRRRLGKATVGLCDNDSRPSLCVDSMRLSPVEIKQEALSPVECSPHELSEQLGVELDLFNGAQQQSVERPEFEARESVRSDNGADESCDFLERMPGLQPHAGGLPIPSPCPSLTMPLHDSANGAVPKPTVSQTTVPKYEDVVKSMQQAYYDLLPILDRVCLTVLGSV